MSTWNGPSEVGRLRFYLPKPYMGTTYEAVVRITAAIEEASFDYFYRENRSLSAHFPVGRYPQIYPESETHQGQRCPWPIHQVRDNADYYKYSPTYRSRYYYPLRRAVWVREGRRKERYDHTEAWRWSD